MGTVGRYVVVLAVAAVATTITVPLARRIAIRLGGVAVPGDRTVHSKPTPRLGGIAMFLGLLAGLVAAMFIDGLPARVRRSGERLGRGRRGDHHLHLGVRRRPA